MKNTFQYEVTRYLDSMPPRSKVAFGDLIAHICQLLSHPNQTIVREWVTEVVMARQDFAVYRGRGIVKNP